MHRSRVPLSLRPLRRLFTSRRLLRSVSAQRTAEVVDELDESLTITHDYVLLTVLSCIIATFGLILDSGAVIIGAMLIAPLMSPILAVALSLVRGDMGRLVLSLRALLIGVATALLISTVLGRFVSITEFGFLGQLPEQILNRTRPTPFDLLVAMAGGTVAAYGLAHPRLSPALPGVAISTALMPPLCVVGIGLAHFQPGIWTGALLLFFANLVAIVFTSAVVFTAIGFGPLIHHQPRHKFISRTFLVPALSLVIIAVPLLNFMNSIVDDTRTDQIIHSTLSHQLELINEDASIVDFQRRNLDGGLHIIATVRAPQTLTQDQSAKLQREVAINLGQPVSLEMFVVRVTRLDPQATPTRTPTSTDFARFLPSPTTTQVGPPPQVTNQTGGQQQLR